MLEVQMCTDRDFAHISPGGQEFLSHVSPKFRATSEFGIQVQDWTGFVDMMAELHEEMPAVHLAVTQLKTEIHISGVRASVFMEGVMEGMPNGVSVGLIAEWRWKKRQDGKWMVIQYQGLRGPSDGLVEAGQRYEYIDPHNDGV